MRALVLLLAMTVSPIGAVVCEWACAPVVESSAEASHAHHHGGPEPMVQKAAAPGTTALSAPAAQCDPATPTLVSGRMTLKERHLLGLFAWHPAASQVEMVRPPAGPAADPPGLSPPRPPRSIVPLRI